ncbi:D-alanyl-D-alanine carboxypeptidase [Paracoccus sp. MC1854]|uniref:D-alanyl-D-alanine carboxypeptidase family protein n=1 Tax=Paracoccus sp. MC1854 TaxID=2760306 RepID=UPI001600E31D|nr:D-alanyl-D-alanine carboxypeptidase family protein [Paracoccus sp. MC1854]MBB1490033.1 D-alanyl-D-alanine carboxypeptidase [Paracoccus sp. MC1854]
MAALIPLTASAAPFAAHVMDGRTGKEIYSQNANARLHPASLTKMMTLYMAFTAIERGQVRLDSRFTVTKHAAGQPPSRLGLRAGQQIELRYLIRAAAVKSANDAATAIGEGLAGSEARFGQQMTAMARALGMSNTTFRNANGLTQDGHYSTARDMSVLGRRLFYDFPQYYSIFSRRSADAGIATVASTNKRFLDSYQGADGIKTGYTRAAGFNLTASAQRGSKRIIATVMGGQSTAQRNAVMAQLLDTGFGKAPARVKEIRPEPPEYMVERKRSVQVARSAPPVPSPVAARPVRGSTVPLEPERRQATAPAPAQAAPVVAQASVGSARPARRPAAAAAAAAAPVRLAAADPAAVEAAVAGAIVDASRPAPAPRSGPAAMAKAPRTPGSTFVAAAAPKQDAAPSAGTRLAASDKPVRKSDTVILAAMEEEGDRSEPEAVEIVSRPSTRGRGNHGITLGRYKTKAEAEQLLLRTALQESAVLNNANRHVGNTPKGWEANFSGLTRDAANLACEKLAARSQRCKVLGN